jgi:DNA processing protein
MPTTNGTSTGATPPPPPDPSTDRLAWIALASLPKLGPRRIAALLSQFETPAGILTASREALRNVDGISATLADDIRGVREAEARALIARADAAGQVVLVPSDPAFPPLLRSIPDPPPLLYTRGALAWLAQSAVAIIGSRGHSRYGEEVAAALARAAVDAGAVVVSGMARGLDAIAHRAALDAGGGTIGVLGAGADIVYPAQNRLLYERVLRGGLLLTESPPGELPIRGSFPRRNRIISGLAQWLVVVEAAEASGTLITVGTALEQGRDVLAVPGPITSLTSRGTNRLLRDGATPILAPEDLAQVLGARSTGASAVPGPVPASCTLSADEACVLGTLSLEAMHIDAVTVAAGLPTGVTLGVLLGLELGGLVEQLPGTHYRRRLQWG